MLNFWDGAFQVESLGEHDFEYLRGPFGLALHVIEEDVRYLVV